MLKVVRNRSLRHYDMLRSQDAIGDLIYFLNSLGDVHVWPGYFGLEKSLNLTSDCMPEKYVQGSNLGLVTAVPLHGSHAESNTL